VVGKGDTIQRILKLETATHW